uniref:Uncharacterized protein n=1 Tax=Escherichia coli TaxID=562 RepID=A0A7A6T745_ECOLX
MNLVSRKMVIKELKDRFLVRRKYGSGQFGEDVFAVESGLCGCVDTVTASKFFPGPVSRIAGMPDTAPSGAVVSSLPRFLRSYRIMP